MTPRTHQPGTSFPENEAIAAALERAARRRPSRGGSRANIRFPKPDAHLPSIDRSVENAHTTLPARDKGHKTTHCNCSHIASTSSSTHAGNAGRKLCTRQMRGVEPFYINGMALWRFSTFLPSPRHVASGLAASLAGES